MPYATPEPHASGRRHECDALDDDEQVILTVDGWIAVDVIGDWIFVNRCPWCDAPPFPHEETAGHIGSHLAGITAKAVQSAAQAFVDEIAAVGIAIDVVVNGRRILANPPRLPQEATDGN